MEYAAHLPNRSTMLVPVLALAIGAGGAVGLYAAVDETDVNIQPTRVVVAETPAQPGQGVSAKDEAASAAAIHTSSPRTWIETKDEAGTAAAIQAPAESSGDNAARTDPHGPAAALP
jgi:hypothetical protein